jgi:hypothetical protein
MKLSLSYRDPKTLKWIESINRMPLSNLAKKESNKTEVVKVSLHVDVVTMFIKLTLHNKLNSKDPGT